MKKLLLSSVIMLGVCGIASAQTDSKFNKKPQTTTSAAAPTPQKAAIMPSSDEVAAPVPVTKTAADKQAAPAPSPVTMKSKAAKTVATPAPATTVNAAGVVVPANKQK